MRITKEQLDKVYAQDFDLETFKSVDPCGVVYKLMKHTDRQLDIELGALFTAMIAWGSRKVICPTAERMLRDEMQWAPADFILSGKFEESYKTAKNNCVYRTLNVDTFKQVCRSIREALMGAVIQSPSHSVILSEVEGTQLLTLESLFAGKSTKEVVATICEWLAPARVGTMDKSACKRVCMFVRWMTRQGAPDFGIWKSRSESDLYAVMDVHVCRLTQDLITQKRPTWRACEELTHLFKQWDADDPLKYDVALMTLADTLPSNP